MGTAPSGGRPRPRSLTEEHESLAAFWPGSGAGRMELATYYQQAARVYAAVAEIEKRRPNETRWWVGECERLAAEYAEKTASTEDASGPDHRCK
jgi:hypothetical protein